jgi:myo-inositol-1(or 4)-monophosphatase
MPIFCASLGFEVDGVAVLGAVYDPTREELFVAERGAGATLNGEPLHVSTSASVSESMLCTGFPYDIHRTREQVVALFGDFVGVARAVRRLGSAALDLCYVAAGRLDGFWEARLKPWDTCAGALMVEEAGGRVTGWDGGVFQSRMDRLVASNGLVHEEMLSVIHAFEARGLRI